MKRSGVHLHIRDDLAPSKYDARINELAAELRTLIWQRGLDQRSISHQGQERSPEMRAKISAKLKGRQFSEESRAKMSAAHTGVSLSRHHRDACGQAQLERQAIKRRERIAPLLATNPWADL
jgi:hypothetical protein